MLPDVLDDTLLVRELGLAVPPRVMFLLSFFLFRSFPEEVGDAVGDDVASLADHYLACVFGIHVLLPLRNLAVPGAHHEMIFLRVLVPPKGFA